MILSKIAIIANNKTELVDILDNIREKIEFIKINETLTITNPKDSKIGARILLEEDKYYYGSSEDEEQHDYEEDIYSHLNRMI